MQEGQKDFLTFASLNVVEKTQQILETNKEKPEAQKLLQEIKEKLTNSFQTKELIAKSDKVINSIEELNTQKKKVGETVDFLVKLFPLKSKILLKEIQELKKLSKNLSSGEKYYNILGRIKYIFPKPHAVAYTTIA
jgi:hypothetical protein